MSGYLQMNEEAKEKLQTLWERIEELNLNVGLSESTMKELKAKISSGIAKCDISVRDYKKYLNK